MNSSLLSIDKKSYKISLLFINLSNNKWFKYLSKFCLVISSSLFNSGTLKKILLKKVFSNEVFNKLKSKLFLNTFKFNFFTSISNSILGLEKNHPSILLITFNVA